MARLLTSGFEIGLGSTAVDGVDSGIGVSFQSSIVRSGATALKIDSTASNSLSDVRWQGPTTVVGRTYYVRAYVYVPTGSLPSTQSEIVRLFIAQGALTDGGFIRLTSSGTLQLWDTVGQVGSDSATIPLDTWFRLEMAARSGTGSTDYLEAYLDGASFASSTSRTFSGDATTSLLLYMGWDSTAPGANKVIYFDDVALNDDQGSSQTTLPGAGKVVLLKPISDNARATLWTGGTGGTTNLWDAVDNTPPVGTATETNTTQIEHAGGASGTTDAYDANMTSYSTAGIQSGDAVNLIVVVDFDGEDVATGSKLLAFSVVSNPAISASGNVTAGNDAGALGTFPINWTGREGAVSYAPSVTLGTSPVMRVVRPETATRVASVCFMGLYVDYTPASDSIPQLRAPINVNQAVARAASW